MAQYVQVDINAKATNVVTVILTTYRRVEVEHMGKKRFKYRRFESISQPVAPSRTKLKHPGKGGILSAIGINGQTRVVYSTIRRLSQDRT